MLTFKEWLRVQEYSAGGYAAQTPYRGIGGLATTRGLGTREEDPNPITRAIHDITPYHVQGIYGTGAGMKSLLMRPAPGATARTPQPMYGTRGYEGEQRVGMKIDHRINSAEEDVDGNPVLAQYRALQAQVYEAINENLIDKLDWSRCYIGQPRSLSSGDKKIYKVTIIIPWKGAPQFPKHPGFISPEELLVQVQKYEPKAKGLKELIKTGGKPPSEDTDVESEEGEEGST